MGKDAEPLDTNPKRLAERAVDQAGSLQDAIDASKGLYGGPFAEEPGGGFAAIALETWAARHMSWSDVFTAKNESSYALAMKDLDGARGKKMCVGGTVLDIKASIFDTRDKTFSGMFRGDDGNRYDLAAVKDTGTLIGGSRARFCGVIIGQMTYDAGGKVALAVTLLGMFDMPNNRRADAGR